MENLKNIEVEKRALIPSNYVHSVVSILENIASLPIQSMQEDKYFCSKCLIDEGRTKESPYIIRIRRGAKGASVCYKSFVKGSTNWIEEDCAIDDPDSFERILQHLGQYPYLNINKHRDSYKIGDFEVNIDAIAELGTFIEVELISTIAEKEVAEKRIYDFLTEKLSLDREAIINTGYVQLMEQFLENK